MRGIVESPQVQDAVDDAEAKWARFQQAWDAITWVLSRDPTVGVPLTEGGNVRSFVYVGSYAHEMPTIDLVYEITTSSVILQEVRFRDAGSTSGRA